MEFGSKEYTPAMMRKEILAEKKVKAGIRAEEVREMLDPKALIESLLLLVESADYVSVEDLPRLKFKADIYTTVLKKCMPDLRSLEIKESASKHQTLIIEMGSSKVDSYSDSSSGVK